MSVLTRLPGLDGLRGVAVMSVIGFHLNLDNVLPAGFLGVDIFFTVSGFIITALMLQEYQQSGGIHFKAFYLRRARRLFPAAFFMLLVLILVTPLLSPAAFPRLREDLPAAIVYASNWWQIVAKQSYFEAIEHPRLLQHLWSLAVEEQYYLLWPLATLFVLNRLGRAGLGIVAAFIAIASTCWMSWIYITQIDGGDPSRVYLGTDTHLMGLLSGSALAALWNPWHERHSFSASDKALNLLGAIGFVALVWMMAQGHEGMPWLYQGGFLLAATITCAVIVAATREGTVLARVLSTLPMRWLGDRSYSLYLWHWPVIVFIPVTAQTGLIDLLQITILRLTLTFMCAEASYRLIEKKWTHILDGKSQSTWVRVLLSAFILASFSVLAFKTSPPPESSTSPVTAAETLPAPLKPTSSPAQTASTSQVAPLEPFPQAAPVAYEHLTLVGDSVLLGASSYLLRRLPSAFVDAKVGRQGGEGIKVIEALRKEQRLGDALVVHLGTNGYLVERQLRALLQNLSDRQIVVVVNVSGARRWTDPNNALINKVSQDFENVKLVDWHALGQSHPEYFAHDSIHLSGSGIHAYYEQIRLALGQPETLFTNPTPPPNNPPHSGKVKSPPKAAVVKNHPQKHRRPAELSTAQSPSQPSVSPQQ